MKRIYQCIIKTVSPLHIGCDEVYEPTGFVLDETRNQLTVFDPITFISQMDETDRKRFSEICARGTIESILEIYKFLRRRKADGKTVQVCSGFVSHYNRTLSISLKDRKRIQQELGRFAVSRTSFLPADGRPYIPGSSVKGSLRTAYLNRMARQNPVPTPKGRQAARKLEKKLLNHDSIQTDPFRLVKVSDFMPVGEVRTKILYAVNIKKAGGTAARGPFQIVETVMPGALFSGSIVVESPLKGVIRQPVDMKTLLDGCKTFYLKEYNREYDELKAAGIAATASLFSKDGLPVRVGRHSGAESVTIEGHRQIRIKGRGVQDHATTLWLASEEPRPRNIQPLQPFGWCEIMKLDDSTRREIEDMEASWAETAAPISPVTAGKEGMSQDDGKAGTQSPAEKLPPEPETWENVVITYAKNTGEVIAKLELKTATTKDRSIIPEAMLEKLMKRNRRKPVTATIKAEHIGGKEYRLIEILDKD